MALVALKHKSVTPIVNVVGAGGSIGAAGAGAAGASPSTGAATGAAGAAFGAGLSTTTTSYLLNSNKVFKNCTRSALAFFSTMAHLLVPKSSNSWFLLIAIIFYLNTNT
jgi:hypothetical protein